MSIVWFTFLWIRFQVLRTMLERVAKARFDGDLDAALRLFRWAVSVVDSRSRESINNIEVDSPLMDMDPWLHLDVEGGGKNVSTMLTHF